MHRNSDAQWVKMNFDIPCYDIEQEYISVKKELVINRPQDGHKDWFATSLFIIDNITEVGLKCTKTLEFIKSLPYYRLDDVRFLVI